MLALPQFKQLILKLISKLSIKAQTSLKNGQQLQSIVALSIVLLSTMVAVIQYQNEQLQMKVLAMRDHNTSTLIKLIDNWAFYQAKSIKGSNSALIAELLPAKKQQAIQSQQRYHDEKLIIKQEVKLLENRLTAISKEINYLVTARLNFLFVSVLLQLAIGLSSIALILRNNLAFLGVIVYNGSCLICATGFLIDSFLVG